MPRPTVYLETFGCQMNELDSELVAGQLRALGYRVTDDDGDITSADVVLYNTCSVRDLAEQKVRSRLGEMSKRKHREPGLVVGVLGCMAERDGPDMLHKFPVVDVLCGPAELDKLPALLDNAVKTRQSLLAEDASPPERDKAGRWRHPAAKTSARQVALQGDASRRSTTLAAASDSLEMLDLSRAVSPIDHDTSEGGLSGGSSAGPNAAYVRITRGCNKFCTYCVVPHTRGAEVHRPPDHIVDECKKLADAGVIEITLLGQTVNHYRFEHGAAVTIDGVLQPQKGRTYKGSHHRDLYAGANTTTFADLLKRIHDEVPAIQRLRFVTSYPRDFGADVLEVIRDSPRICRYLHCPAQSGSDAVLKRMNRGYTSAEFIEWADRARHYLDQPELGRPLTIAGDIIVGFCGETEDDFALTKDLLRRVRFKNNFIFKYSPRPGTVAFDRIPDDVPDPVKKRRCNELLALQGEISEQIGREQVGRTFDVFVQGVSSKQRKAAKSGAPGAVALTIAGRDADHAPDDEQPTDHIAAVERDGGRVQLSGRTDGDLIVCFDAPANRTRSLIGAIHPVRIANAKGLTLFGNL
jgi:tRNA-2-methylthio-N6-dimethylallyladenosine synthase